MVNMDSDGGKGLKQIWASMLETGMTDKFPYYSWCYLNRCFPGWIKIRSTGERWYE